MNINITRQNDCVGFYSFYVSFSKEDETSKMFEVGVELSKSELKGIFQQIEEIAKKKLLDTYGIDLK
jgi:hypothetical protein